MRLQKRGVVGWMAGVMLVLGFGFGLALTPGAPIRAQAPEPQSVRAAVGTAFTYQGRLTDDQGDLLTGLYDFEFRLYDDTGAQAAGAVTFADLALDDGHFTVDLDFGADAFNGTARWLEIRVREGESAGSYTTLTPRQPLTPAPYALALPGLHTEPDAAVPNILGGYAGNLVDSGASGAVIGGGGGAGEENRVTGDHGTIGGGSQNVAGVRGTVAGGQSNRAEANAAVGGGLGNEALDQGATVGGGQDNVADYLYGTVGGGLANRTDAYGATIAGGAPSDPGDPANTRNEVVDHYGAIGGGGDNLAGSDDGTPDNARWATVGGGDQNRATGPYATVAGGRTNLAGGTDVYHATVGGGVENQATGSEAAVAGGNGNIASGTASAVPGGFDNEAAGNYSLAAGYRARADHSGTFVWADATKADFASTADDQFLIRAGGGVGIGTNAPGDAALYVQGSNCCTDAVVDNHIAVVENQSTNAAADVLALKSNRSSPNTGVNYITFFDGDGMIGEIEGDGSGGIVLDSASSDFAERLPKADPDASLNPGDVVGLKAGRVSRKTAGAERAMVVSTAPIVVGNRQPEDAADRYAPIAFVGQVPVKVRGPVRSGDYILPSGREDGTGIAVPPEAVTAAQVGRIVGRALEDREGPAVGQVEVLVGLPQTEILQTVMARRDARFERQAARLDELEARVAALEQAQASVGSAASDLFSAWPLVGGLLAVGAVFWRRRGRQAVHP